MRNARSIPSPVFTFHTELIPPTVFLLRNSWMMAMMSNAVVSPVIVCWTVLCLIPFFFTVSLTRCSVDWWSGEGERPSRMPVERSSQFKTGTANCVRPVTLLKYLDGDICCFALIWYALVDIVYYRQPEPPESERGVERVK